MQQPNTKLQLPSKSGEILKNEMAVVNRFEIHRYQTDYSRTNKINNMIIKLSGDKIPTVKG